MLTSQIDDLQKRETICWNTGVEIQGIQWALRELHKVYDRQET